jgi:hypothetical protein
MAGASTLEKLAVAREHGADALVDYATEPLTDRVMALTDGRAPTCASSGRRRGYKLVRLFRGSEKPSRRDGLSAHRDTSDVPSA